MARKEFSRKTRQAIIQRANGRCEVCKAVLKTGEGEVDHILADALGGEPTIANGRLLCNVCHKTKTATDISMIRKADRQRDKRTGAMKSKFPMSKHLKETKPEAKPLPPRRGGIAAQYIGKD